MAMAPATKTELNAAYFLRNLLAINITKEPHKTPIPTRAGSFIQFLSIAYFTK